MSKGKKVIITILVDAVMLAVLVFSVYSMLFRAKTESMKNVYTALIVITIPVIFLVTYMNVAGDKYDYKEEDFEEDEFEEGTETNTEINSETNSDSNSEMISEEAFETGTEVIKNTEESIEA